MGDNTWTLETFGEAKMESPTAKPCCTSAFPALLPDPVRRGILRWDSRGQQRAQSCLLGLPVAVAPAVSTKKALTLCQGGLGISTSAAPEARCVAEEDYEACKGSEPAKRPGSWFLTLF